MCLQFFLRCFSFCSGLLNQNSGPVFVAFFFLCFLLCCLAIFVFKLLSFLCLVCIFILRYFFLGDLHFPVVFFALIDLLICTIYLLFCARLHVCLWDLLGLVPECSFPYPLVAYFACFFWALNVFFYPLRVRPSTLSPQVSPVLLCLCLSILRVQHDRILVHNERLCSFLPLSRSPTLTNSHPHPSKPQNIKHIFSITTLTHSNILSCFC